MSITRKFKLSLAALLVVFITSVCSSGYITPDSLAETAQAQNGGEQPPTAYYIPPTASPTPLPSATPTQAPPTETAIVLPTDTPGASPTPGPPILYNTQSGDSLESIAARFNVEADQISSNADFSEEGFINPGTLLVIPDNLGETTSNELLIADSEVVYSPSTLGFSAQQYAESWDSYLATYRQYVSRRWYDGGDLVEKVAIENSINPRLLLSILQYESNWVLGGDGEIAEPDYPIIELSEQNSGLYRQLVWVVNQLSTGYYGWRDGTLTNLVFSDGTTRRIAPDLNAGSVALQYLFSQLYDYEEWLEVVDRQSGFPFTHGVMFPDPWVRAAQEEPLFPPALEQPDLSLPFYANQVWYFTSGPHGAWETVGAMGALDFAPSSNEPGCNPSTQWITATAPGLIVRVSEGVLVLDLDGDGNEQTGWVVLYLHLSHENRHIVGEFVDRGTVLGVPSCEGGRSTGTHLHIARKYNGEWLNAGGPLPFVLSGWETLSAGIPYQGTLNRDGETVTACTCSNVNARIARRASDPY